MAEPGNQAFPTALRFRDDAAADEPSVSLDAFLDQGEADSVRIEAGGKPIDTAIGHAAPFVADFDGDGVRDLLVGQFGDGILWIFRNEGADAAPKLAAGVKFEAAALPTSAVVRPLSAATFRATSTAKAGSLRLPRCGGGARKGASVSTNRRSSGTSRATRWIVSARGKATIPEKDS